MKYILFSPSYTGTCLKEEFGDEIELKSLDLPESVIKKIEEIRSLYVSQITKPLKDSKFSEIKNYEKKILNVMNLIKENSNKKIKIKFYDNDGILHTY